MQWVINGCEGSGSGLKPTVCPTAQGWEARVLTRGQRKGKPLQRDQRVKTRPAPNKKTPFRMKIMPAIRPGFNPAN